MTKVILYEETIKDIDILTSALKVPYVLIQSADQSADQSPDQSDSWAKAIDAEDFSTTNTVAFLYESSAVVNGIPPNFDSLIKSITTKSEKLETIDLLTCNLTNNVSIDKIKALEARYNVQIRYSVDLTGHGDSMGDWVLESHDTDVKDIYFNEKIDEWKHILNNIDGAGVLTVTDATKITTSLDDYDIRHTTIGTTIYQSNGSDIRHIIFSNPVETLINAFENFTNLKSVTFSDTVNLVGMRAFNGCTRLESVTFNGAVGTLHDPVHAHGIMHQAFRNCTSLESVTFSDAVNHINKKAFEGCTGLTNVTFSDTVNSIGESAFEGCTGLTNVTFSDTVNSIVESAFKGCIGLTNVTFSDTVNSIGVSAFEGCNGLTSILIPRGVEIGESAFKLCTGLTSITVHGDGTNIIHKDAFAEIYMSGLTDDAPTFLYIVDADAEYFAANPSAPPDYRTSFADRFSAANTDASTDVVANDVMIGDYLPFGKARTTMYDLVAEAWGMIEKPSFTGKSEKGEFTLPHGFVDRPGLGNKFSSDGPITAFAGKIITLITSRDQSVGQYGVILENGTYDQIVANQTGPVDWFDDKQTRLDPVAVQNAMEAESVQAGVEAVVMNVRRATNTAENAANAVRLHALQEYEAATDSDRPLALAVLERANTLFTVCRTADTNAKDVDDVSSTFSSAALPRYIANYRSGLAADAAAAAAAAKTAIETFTSSTSGDHPGLYAAVQNYLKKDSDPSLNAALYGVAGEAARPGLTPTTSAASDKASRIDAAVNAFDNAENIYYLFKTSDSYDATWIKEVWRPFESKKDLSNHLINHDLSYADLSNATLTGAYLTNATLTGAVTGPLHGGPTNNITGYKVVSNSSTPPQTWIVGPGVDLSGADLSGTDLSGADLSGVDLAGAVTGPLAANSATPSNLPTGYVFVNGTEKWLLQLGPGANLTNVVLSGANLSGFDLSGADLYGAVLTNAVTGPLAADSTAPSNLPTGFVFVDGTEKWLVGPGANLTDAVLTGAVLSGVDLSGANLTDAVLSGVDLSGADMSGVDLTGADTGPLAPDSTTPSNLPTGYVFDVGTEKRLRQLGPAADLKNAVLSGVDLSGVDLSGADLTGAVLTKVVTGPLVGAPTAGKLPTGYKVLTIASETWLVGPGANLSGTDLSGVVLTGVDGLELANCNFSDANLSGVDLSGADLTNCDFSNANLEGVKFNGNTNLTGVDFSYANLMIDANSEIGSNNQLKSNSWQPHKRLYLGSNDPDYNKPAITDGFNIEVTTSVDNTGLSWDMKLIKEAPSVDSTWVLEVYSGDKPIILKDNFQFFYNLPAPNSGDISPSFTKLALESLYDKFFSSHDQRQLSLQSGSNLTVNGPGGSAGDHIEENNDGDPVQMKNVVVFYNLALTGSATNLDLQKNIAVFFKNIVEDTFISDAVVRGIAGPPKVNYIDYYIDKSEKPYITIGDYTVLNVEGKPPGKTVTLISNSDLSSIKFGNGTTSAVPLSAGFNTLTLTSATTMNVTHKDQTYTATFAPGANSSRLWEQLDFKSDDYEATGTVTISTVPPGGVVKTETTLKAQVVDASDIDGDIVSYQYVWKAGGNILQTTSAKVSNEDTYVVESNLVGQEITCEVTTTDDQSPTPGTTTLPESAGVTVVDTPSTFSVSINDANGSPASLPLAGETLTTIIGDLTDPDVNTGELTVTYSWKRNDVAIAPAATNATYMVAAIDLGQTLTVDVTVTQAGQTSVPNSASVTVSSATVHTYNVRVNDGKFVVKTDADTHLDLNNFVHGDEYKFVGAPPGHPFRLGEISSSLTVPNAIEIVFDENNKFQYNDQQHGDLYVYCEIHGFGMGSLYNGAHASASQTFNNLPADLYEHTVPATTSLAVKNANGVILTDVGLDVNYYDDTDFAVTRTVADIMGGKKYGKYYVKYTVDVNSPGVNINSSDFQQRVWYMPRHTWRSRHRHHKNAMIAHYNTIIQAIGALLRQALSITKRLHLQQVDGDGGRKRITRNTWQTDSVVKAIVDDAKTDRNAIIDADPHTRKTKKQHRARQDAKDIMKTMFAAVDSDVKEIEVETADIFGDRNDEGRPGVFKGLPSRMVVMKEQSDGDTVSIEDISFTDLQNEGVLVPLSAKDEFIAQKFKFSDGKSVEITTTLTTFAEDDDGQIDIDNCKYSIAIANKDNDITVSVWINGVLTDPTTYGNLPTDSTVRITNATKTIVKVLGGSTDFVDNVPTGSPTITPSSGSLTAPYINQTLTVDASGSITDLDDTLTHTYQWYRDNTLIVTAANAALTSTSWIGVYHSDYASYDLATAAAYAATNQGAEILRRGIYYTWEYVNGTGSGNPADAGTTVTFNFSRMLSGTYNVVMFENGSEPDVEVSNVLTVSVNGNNGGIQITNYGGDSTNPITAIPGNPIISNQTGSTYGITTADAGHSIKCEVTSTETTMGGGPYVSYTDSTAVLPKITAAAAEADDGQNISVNVSLSGEINAGDKFVMTKAGSIVHSFTLDANQTTGKFYAAFKSGNYNCEIQTISGVQRSNKVPVTFADNEAQKNDAIIESDCTVGTEINAKNSVITDVDGIAADGYSYQWKYSDDDGVNWSNITDANNNPVTTQTFTPTLAQYKKKIRVVVTTTDSNNGTTIIESQASTVGDPYVAAANGKVSKLPDQHGFYRMFEHADMFVNVEVDSKDIGEEMAQYCKTYGISHDEPEYKNHRIVTHGYWNRNVWIESEGNTFELDLFTKQMTFEQNYFKYNIVKDNFQYNMDLADKTITRSLHIKWIHSRYGLQSIVIDFYANPQVMNGIRMVSGLLWSSKSTGMLVKNYKPTLMSLKRLTDNKSGKLAKKLGKTSSTLHSKPIMARGEIWTRGTTKKKIVKRRK